MDSWRCPYCNEITSDKNYSNQRHNFDEGNKEGKLALGSHVRICPNSKCKEYTIEMWLQTYRDTPRGQELTGEKIETWKLKPQSSAKPLPDYIPEVIRNDYAEACLIAALSPKASATLSRRCLQGMIRDFWDVNGKTLYAEIQGIKDKVDPTTWEAIDAVRSIGNIGAHMEQDIM